MPKLKDKLPGGLADGKDLKEFDINQLLKGILTEYEHTDDTGTSLEISTDHLEEDEKYYDHLDEMEQKYAGADSINLETGEGLGKYVNNEILQFAPPDLVEAIKQKYLAAGKSLEDLTEDDMIALLDDLLDFNVTGSYNKHTSARLSNNSWTRIAEACKIKF